MVERRQVFRNAQGKRSLKIIKLQTLEINTQVLLGFVPFSETTAFWPRSWGIRQFGIDQPSPRSDASVGPPPLGYSVRTGAKTVDGAEDALYVDNK